MVTIGIDVIQYLSKLRVDIAFIGVSALSIKQGITDEGYEVSLIKKAMIQASERVVYLATYNKLDVTLNYDVCSFNKIDTVVTDYDLENPMLKSYKNAGLHLV